MAARSIWKGAIAFGLVNIPVGLTSAEESPEGVSLNLVDSKNNARIRYKKVNSETDEEVPAERIVKGYEVEEGHFILFDDQELESITPQLTKTIEIEQFVKLADVEPLLFEKPYYLEPEKRGKKAYALLRETLRQTGMAGIARVVVRTKEYLTAMFVRGDAVILEMLRFPQEIRSADKLDLPASSDPDYKPNPRELDLAKHLVAQMTEKWNPAEHHDEYQKALQTYVDQKIASGATSIVKGGHRERDTAPATNMIDLAAYLEQSIKTGTGAKAKAAATKATSKPTAKKPAAAKKAAKKAAKRSA
ncbi:Ku protein [Haloferula sp. BvORR071]|uniref:non-homologous end joining protein Ku n=1 Tax=Haloferula sp. BvORR071 TaxID=1396141 RepID=UPI0005598F9E|nr:Ku protein [Haloferula sp. BvORR071]